MDFLIEKDFKKTSLILIVLTILLNVCIFRVMPSDMLIKVNTNQAMSKAFVLSLCPILSALTLWIAKEKNEHLYYLTNILVQVILFISNLIVIYINLK